MAAKINPEALASFLTGYFGLDQFRCGVPECDWESHSGQEPSFQWTKHVMAAHAPPQEAKARLRIVTPSGSGWEDLRLTRETYHHPWVSDPVSASMDVASAGLLLDDGSFLEVNTVGPTRVGYMGKVEVEASLGESIDVEVLSFEAEDPK